MPKSILLVDDDDSLRLLMSLLLRRAGYIVYEAANATEAQDLIRMTVPDLCILDVMMPGISGFELCLDLRENPRTADCPIFLLTARANAMSEQAARDCGATLYLTKPTPTDELLTYIEEHVKESIINPILSHTEPSS